MTQPTVKQSTRFPPALASAIACAMLLASFLAAGRAGAAAYTWTGNNSTAWSTSGNWNPSTVPGSGDEADFTGTFTNSPSLAGNPYLGQLHALGALAESFTATVGSGQTLTLEGTNNGNTGILVDYDSIPNNTVTLTGGAVSVGATQSWLNNNTNGSGFATPGSGQYSLTVSSNVNMGPPSVTLTLAGSGATWLSGVVAGSLGGITVNSNGLAELSGANTFTGNVSITQGTLLVSSIANIGTAQPLGMGGTLSLGGSATSGELNLMENQTGTTNRAITINAGGGTLLVDQGASDTFSGSISGSGALYETGGGTLTLASGNTYTGGTTINSGVLQVALAAALPGYAKPGEINVASGATLDISEGHNGWSAASITSLVGSNASGFASGSILDIDTAGVGLTCNANIAGNMGLTKLGGNTLTLTGSSTYAGPTAITAGTLQIGNGGNGASIDGTSGITDNVSLVFNHGDAATFNPVITGSGSLIVPRSLEEEDDPHEVS